MHRRRTGAHLAMEQWSICTNRFRWVAISLRGLPMTSYNPDRTTFSGTESVKRKTHIMMTAVSFVAVFFPCWIDLSFGVRLEMGNLLCLRVCGNRTDSVSKLLWGIFADMDRAYFPWIYRAACLLKRDRIVA